MQRTELFKGVNLNTIRNNKFKTNFLSVCFVLPIEKENVHLTALVPKVLARGCKNYPSMAEISERLEYLYATDISPIYEKRAETVIMGFSADFIRDGFLPKGSSSLLDAAANLLLDIIFEPLCENGAFSQEYTEGEKTDLINAIGARINDKGSYAKSRLTEIMFENHAYGCSILGDEKDVENSTAKDVYERYLEIINNAPIEIFFNGDGNTSLLTQLLKNRIPFSESRKTEFPKCNYLTGIPEKVTEVTEEMPVAQGKLVLGYRMDGVNLNSTEAGAFYVFNEIFGGSPSSKLFMNVREKMSLCYYCSSSPDMFMSVLFIRAGIESENRQKALSAISEQLEAMKNGEFSEDDISDAKHSLCNSYRELSDSACALCLWYLSRIINHSTLTPEDMPEILEKVTAKDITECAKKVSLNTVYFIKGTAKPQEDEI